MNQYCRVAPGFPAGIKLVKRPVSTSGMLLFMYRGIYNKQYVNKSKKTISAVWSHFWNVAFFLYFIALFWGFCQKLNVIKRSLDIPRDSKWETSSSVESHCCTSAPNIDCSTNGLEQPPSLFGIYLDDWWRKFCSVAKKVHAYFIEWKVVATTCF